MIRGGSHFLDIHLTEATALRRMLDAAATLKAGRAGWSKGTKEMSLPLQGKAIALIFERPSTRTRVSFEMAIRQLGGEALVLTASETQLGRGESIADTARVLSRYVDGIVLRAANHINLVELAEHATVPVINGLTDKSHPCQVMADVLTLEERKGALDKQTVSWVGDGNNVAASWVHAVGQLGGALRLGCPHEYALDQSVAGWAKSTGAQISFHASAEEAVSGSDCVVTDAWVSMHDSDGERRHNILKPYQVNATLMKLAKPDAVFMHCLPAHRNDEVTDQVMDGPQSVVFDEAENRLHAQKAILLHCLGLL
jgi:ornithine carbamoyltransferase